MSTSHLTRKQSRFDRFVDYLLDVDGDMYGQDERERTRWYEGIALAASVQWIVFPWFLAILVWFVDVDVARLLGTAGVVFLAPMILATVYVERKRVDTRVHRWTSKRIVWSVVTITPIVVFLAGFIRAVGLDTPVAKGALVGGIIGGIAGGVAMVVRGRKLTSSDDDE